MLKRLLFVLLLCASSLATTYHVNPAGNDANTGLSLGQAWATPQHATSVAVCGDTVKFGGTHYILADTWFLDPVLANGGVGTCAPGNEIIYTVEGSATPDFIGATIDDGTGWVNDANDPNFPLCNTPNCTTYYKVITPTYLFEDLYYSQAGSALRRSRPNEHHKNQLTPSGSAAVCVTGIIAPHTNPTENDADIQCTCPAAVAAAGENCTAVSIPCANAAGVAGPFGKYMCFNRFMFANTDIKNTWQGMALGDIEIYSFGLWTSERTRLLTSASNIGYLTGHTLTTNGNSGFVPGHDYVVDGVADDAAAGDWLLVRCPSNPACTTPEINQRLYIFAGSTENPTTATSIFYPNFPIDHPLLSLNNVNGRKFIGLTFQVDNHVPGPLGDPDSQGMPRLSDAVKWTNSSFNFWQDNTIAHTGGWCLGVHRASTNNTFLGQNLIYDCGAGGFRLGDIACPSPGSNGFQGCDANNSATWDTAINIPSFNTINNMDIGHTGRTHSSGEATVLYIGDAHDNSITHNDVFGGYAGCINFGHGLNRGQIGTSNAFFFYNNYLSWNLCYGEGSLSTGDFEGIQLDDGGIYSAANASINCPTQGQPTVIPFTYCNSIDHNVVHDIASNFSDLTHHGAAGIYLDQGTSFMYVAYNLVYRVGQDCIFANTPSHGGGNPAAVYLPQYNLFENNILVACGVHIYNNTRVINRGGINLNSFEFRKNIVLYDSAVSNHIQAQPGFWACDDFSSGTPVPVDCTQAFYFHDNIYWDIRQTPVDMVTCINPLNCQAGLTHYNTLPWGTGTLLEDLNSYNVDPHLVNPVFPADNFTPSGALPNIGFVMWDYTQAGRTDRTKNIPGVPNLYPLRTVNALTDFFVGYSPSPRSVWGGGAIGGVSQIGH